MRAAAESPSSRRFPFTESLCFFIFFWRASSRWLPPRGRRQKVSGGGLAGRTPATPQPRRAVSSGVPDFTPGSRHRPVPGLRLVGGGVGRGDRAACLPACHGAGQTEEGRKDSPGEPAGGVFPGSFGAAWAPRQVGCVEMGGVQGSGRRGGSGPLSPTQASPRAAEGRGGPPPDPGVGGGGRASL